MTSDRDILEKLIEQMFVVITLLRTMRTISEVNPLKVAEIGKSISIKYFQGFFTVSSCCNIASTVNNSGIMKGFF